jgi:O-antigen/teichoic acid export membrane protein
MTVGARRIASGFGWQAFNSYANRFFSLIATLILAKVLTPEHFGLVAIASMILEALQILKDMGLSEALISQKRDDEALMNTAHTILVGFNAFLFILAALVSPLAARFYDNSLVMPVIIVMSSNLIWDSLRSVPRTMIRRNIEFHKLVVPEVVPVAISSAVSIAMALTGFGVWSLVAKAVLHSFIGLVLVHWTIPFRPRFAFDRDAARELFAYGKFIMGATILFVLLYNIDRFYVSKFAGVAALGLFELARSIAELPVRQFSFLVGAVMFPVFSRIERSGAGLRGAFVKTLKYTGFVTIPMSIGISTFAPPVIASVYGERWASMITPLRVLAFYAIFRSLGSLIHDALKAINRPDVVVRFAILKLALIGGLGVPVVQREGLVGMCWLILGTYFIGFLCELWTARLYMEVPFFSTLAQVASTFVLSFVTIQGTYVALHWIVASPSTWQVVAAIPVAGALYALILCVADRDAVRDLRAVTAPRPAA